MLARDTNALNNWVRHVELVVGYKVSEQCGNQDIQDRANPEWNQEANRHIPLRISCLLRGGGHGIETDIGKKHNTSTTKNPRPAEVSPFPRVGRDERMPVVWLPGVRQQESRSERYENAYYSHL